MGERKPALIGQRERIELPVSSAKFSLKIGKELAKTSFQTRLTFERKSLQLSGAPNRS